MVKILHVDDNGDDLDLTKQKLRLLDDDLDIDWSESAEEALARLEKSEYDCVLSDFQMPVMDGLQLLQSIRQRGETVPFIFLTGQGNEEIAAQALRTGADDYFTKEWGFAHYERLLNSILRVVEIHGERQKHRRAEQALRESEERYRNLVERANDGIILIQDSHIVFANERVAEMAGYKVEELIGKPFTDFVHADEVARLNEIHKRRFAGEDIPSIYETKFLRKDGSCFHAEVNAGMITHQGTPTDLVIIRDITERKHSEKMRDSIYKISEAAVNTANLQELYSSIHRIVGELMPAENFYIALHDPVLELLSFPYFVDQYDDTPAPNKTGKGLTEYVLRTGQPLLALPKVFEELEAKGEVEPIGADSIDWLGVPLKTPDRTIGVLTVQSYTEGIRYGEEEKKILMFVSTQVAMAIERKQTEQALKEGEERHRNLVERANDGIALIQDSIIKYANQRLTEFTGYSRDELIGTTITDYVHPDEVGKIGELYKRRMAGEDVPPIYETVIRHKKGAEVRIEVNAGLIQHQGRPADLVILRDISQRGK